jgi:hypothetical protein
MTRSMGAILGDSAASVRASMCSGFSSPSRPSRFGLPSIAADSGTMGTLVQKRANGFLLPLGAYVQAICHVRPDVPWWAVQIVARGAFDGRSNRRVLGAAV